MITLNYKLSQLYACIIPHDLIWEWQCQEQVSQLGNTAAFIFNLIDNTYAQLSYLSSLYAGMILHVCTHRLYRVKKRNKKIVDEKVTDLALNSLTAIQSEVLTAYSQKELKRNNNILR